MLSLARGVVHYLRRTASEPEPVVGSWRKNLRRANADGDMVTERRPARRHRGRRVIAAVKFLRRALAILLIIVAHTFLLNLPHPPSVTLGVAYGASALCSAAAAWRLWWRTFD